MEVQIELTNPRIELSASIEPYSGLQWSRDDVIDRRNITVHQNAEDPMKWSTYLEAFLICNMAKQKESRRDDKTN